MSVPLPDRASLEQLRKQAKELRNAAHAGDPGALDRIRALFPSVSPSAVTLAQSQLVLARSLGFASWAKLKRALEGHNGVPPPHRAFRRELETYEGRAHGLHSVVRGGLPAAAAQARRFHPRFANASVPLSEFTLDDARLVVARQHGCDSWTALEEYVGALASGERTEPFLEAFEAMEAGDAARLRTLIAQSPEIVSAAGTNGNTLLGLAASLAANRDLHQLPGVEPGTIDRQWAMCEMLLAAGADVAAGNDRGWTPLHQAAYSDNGPLIDRLLDAGAPLDPSAHGDGGTPMMVALFWGHRAAAERLASVRVLPANLRAAAGLGRPDLMERLIRDDGTLAPDAGAHRAFYRPHSGFPVWRPTDDPSEIVNEALVYAAKSGRGAAMEYLIERGANVDAEPYNGTALHWAAANGHADAVRLLADRRADLNRAASFGGVGGITALHCAAWSGQMEAIAALLAAGADVARRDPTYHGFPFGWANHAGHAAVRDFLLETGAETDIFHAIAADRPDRAAALLDADPALVNRDDGWTLPLTDAAEQGRADIVRLLLERGADPLRVDPQGRTAASIASAAGHGEIAAILAP